MNIVLISANKLKEPYPVYPLGLDYVYGAISAEHNVKILDMNDFDDIEDIGAAIMEAGPDIAGISLRNMDNTDASNIKFFISQYQKLVNEIRKNTSAVIVLGGSAFTIFPSELIDALDADYGIIGEGERFNLLLKAIRDKKDPAGLPGLIKKNSPAIIPEPWGTDIKRNFIAAASNAGFYLKNGGMLNLQTKRGCSFKCIYCTYPHIEGSNLRLFDPAGIAETAIELQRAGAKYIFVTDSAFNCSYEHSSEVAKAFIKSGLSIPWGAFFAPTRPPADYYSLLKDAGLTHVEFGTESLSDKILRSYRKPFNTADVFNAHGSVLKTGLHIAHYLLPGGPGESRETLMESLTNADKLAKSVFFAFCGIRIYPHTELREIAINEGQISPSQSLMEPVFYRPRDISNEEIIKSIEEHANGRKNWVTGSGGRKSARLMKIMYRQGHTGPLWEQLIG